MSRTHHPGVVAAAIALPVALAAGIITAAVIVQHRGEPTGAEAAGPVTVAALPAPAAGSPACLALLATVPDTLGDATAAQLTAPAPPGVAAWRSPAASDPLVLRCGITRPTEFTAATSLVQVNGVQWLQISGQPTGQAATTWVAVDRSVYLAITLPNGSGSAPVQDTSEAIKEVLPAQQPNPAPVR